MMHLLTMIFKVLQAELRLKKTEAEIVKFELERRNMAEDTKLDVNLTLADWELDLREEEIAREKEAMIQELASLKAELKFEEVRFWNL
jgi:hypothetical protein